MSFKVIQINFDYLLTGIVFVTEAIDNSTMRNKLFFVGLNRPSAIHTTK